jgi:hypothetical protein
MLLVMRKANEACFGFVIYFKSYYLIDLSGAACTCL